MLGCVALLCVLPLVHAQEAFYDGYAYTKVMADCLGQEVYHQYLRKVTTARSQCDGLPPSTTLHTTSSSFTPFFTVPQVRRTRQLGGLLSQQPTVFPQQPGIFSQQPGIFVQHPGIFSRQPGILSRQPGFFTHQPGVFSQQPRIFSPQSGIFTPQSGIFPQQPAVQGVVGPPQPHVFTRLPDNSQRWAAVLGPREILEAKDQATALLGNLTCVLRQLGMVNSQLEINYDGMTTNVFNMAIDTALKDDLISSIDYCRDITLCLPVEKRQMAGSHQLQRLIAFLRCEKESRLMACLKHDLKKSINYLNFSGFPDSGGRTNDLEKLLSFLVTAKSANELQLLVELGAL